ncbi:MAG: DNA replication/repair protein RecF, partial [Spirochaetota bacterium]
GRLPVLLLDDVLLELDPARRGRFVEALPDYEQAFFTFLPDEQYARFRQDTTKIYRVQSGEIVGV